MSPNSNASKVPALLGALLLSFFAAAGCGDDASTTGGDALSVPNACSLVSPAQVEDLLGYPADGVRETSTIAGATLDRCDWNYESETVLKDYSLKLSVSEAAAYSGEDGLLPSEPYALGDEARIQVLDRSVQIIWKSGAYSGDLKFAVLGELDAPIETYRAKLEAIAADVNAQF
jgi:hypothetical protein